MGTAVRHPRTAPVIATEIVLPGLVEPAGTARTAGWTPP